MPPSAKFILAVSGLGNATGTGAAVARLFSQQLGYRIALISRPRKDVDDLRDEIKKAGGVVEVFGVETYDYKSMQDVLERVQQTWPDGRLKCAVWNTAQWCVAPFLPPGRKQGGVRGEDAAEETQSSSLEDEN